MKIEITAFPEKGYELFFRNNDTCYAKLYKDAKTVTENDETREYADVVMHVIYFDDIATVESDVAKNFDYYFEQEKVKELIVAKATKLEELKNAAFATDFPTVKEQIAVATTQEELDAITISG